MHCRCTCLDPHAPQVRAAASERLGILEAAEGLPGGRSQEKPSMLETLSWQV